LAKRLGVVPSIETVKHLETFEMTKDPRPLKKAKRTPTDEEMVDIWGSDFEEELVPTEDTAGPSGTTQRLVTHMVQRKKPLQGRLIHRDKIPTV